MKSALYRMKSNKYLGDCVAIVTQLTEQEAEGAGLTRPEVVTLLRVSKSKLKKINTLEDVRSGRIFDSAKPVLRVGSECMFGMFGDTHCDCEPERRQVLREMKNHAGVYIHLPQEAQGQGLLYKGQELHLQVSGFDPEGNFVGQLNQREAAAHITGSSQIDVRGFDVVRILLRELGLIEYEYRLISRSPVKQAELEASGVRVSSLVDLGATVSPENLGEYLTKWLYKGYSMDAGQCTQIIDLLVGNEAIPPRAGSLVGEAKLALSSQESTLEQLLPADERLRGRLLEAIRNPTNPTLDGAQSALITLLDQAAAYDEFQYELVLDDLLDEHVIATMRPDGDPVLWHEKNLYFFFPQMGQKARDLKIRVTRNVAGKFQSARLIHKTLLGPNEFRIRSVAFSDPVIVALLQESVFAEYEQREVESVTHPLSYPEEGLKVIIKRYAGDLRTISIERREEDVRRWRQRTEDALDRRLEPVETDRRSFGPRVQGHFDRDHAIKVEFQQMARYSGVEL